jgi:IstB-like ATP binding protein
LPDGAAELVFQVLSERHERGSLIVTTNLPFGEWTKVFPDARLAKVVVDRLTHRAHIIDTGNESWRFPHGLERQGRKKGMTPRPGAAPAAIATQALALRARLRRDGRSSQMVVGRTHGHQWGEPMAVARS